MTNETQRYQKISISLKAYLKGKNFHKALEAFEFARRHHTGFRKDLVTPEFQHQIEIALFITDLKELQDEETTLIAALLHDVREDYNIDAVVIEEKFGRRVADVVEKLTKEFKGTKKNMDEYFKVIGDCPIASIVKIADRIHNVSSMVGVFTVEKQEKYLQEIEKYFIPMIKVARNNFPHQLASYHIMMTFLKTMSKTIEAVLLAEKELIEIKAPKIKM